MVTLMRRGYDVRRMSRYEVLDQARTLALDFLRSLPDRPVAPRATRDELLAALRVPLRDDGEEESRVLETLASAEPGIVGSAGPRYFGFVIGGSLPVALAADWLTSAWDQNGGIYVTSPAASVVEDIAREWLLDLFDLPRDGGVGFVTGCQMANWTALAAARHGVLRRAGWNVEQDGLAGAPPVALIVSADAHITVISSMRYLGFGTRALRRVPTDAQGRMRADALREAMREVAGPAIVCAQAGNVNSGAVDPLREIADIAHERGAWLHVDAAFGLWARASRERRALLDGIELADSWATDAHKWLNVPYDSGVVIVRDAAAHRASLTMTAEYLEQTAGAERDAIDWVPEFSRRARGFATYAALRHLGRRGVESLVDRCCDHARRFAAILGARPGVRILNDVVLNQVLVRFGDSDTVTRDTIVRVQRDGTCWLAGSTWKGEAVMRISVSNWSTTEEDVERSAAAIVRAYEAAQNV
jgi:glutamate/tyrosine decarboxylase-like PLP-dependent enzyme